jgi:hypothetical protein
VSGRLCVRLRGTLNSARVGFIHHHASAAPVLSSHFCSDGHFATVHHTTSLQACVPRGARQHPLLKRLLVWAPRAAAAPH